MLISTTLAPAQVDTWRLDQITSEQYVYIQKGWPANIAQCAVDNISQIVRDYRNGEQWLVFLDANIQPITIKRVDGGATIVCQPDGQRNFGTDGQPYDSLVPYQAMY